jgi:hypothetical protein
MKPKLRRFQITPIEQDGSEFLLLHDPMGIAADSGVPRELGYLLSLFDGTRTHARSSPTTRSWAAKSCRCGSSKNRG